MNPSMGAKTVHSGQLLKPGGSFWVFRMSNEFAGQYRQWEHQCQIPLRSDRNSTAMAGPPRLYQDTIWFVVFLRNRLRCSDTEFAEPSFVLMFAWTLINNSLFRHIEH